MKIKGQNRYKSNQISGIKSFKITRTKCFYTKKICQPKKKAQLLPLAKVLRETFESWILNRTYSGKRNYFTTEQDFIFSQSRRDLNIQIMSLFSGKKMETENSYCFLIKQYPSYIILRLIIMKYSGTGSQIHMKKNLKFYSFFPKGKQKHLINGPFRTQQECYIKIAISTRSGWSSENLEPVGTSLVPSYPKWFFCRARSVQL